MLDKSVIKKMVAKKCVSMFPKKVTMTVDDEKSKMQETTTVVKMEKKPSKALVVQKEDSVESPRPENKSGYSYMMKQMKIEIGKKGYVREDPNYERRKARFIFKESDKAEDILVKDIMQKIGLFQMLENDLTHIKGFAKAQEN